MDVAVPGGADEGAVGVLDFLWPAVLHSATGIRTAAAIVLVTGYLTARDAADAPKVAIISERIVREFS